MKALASFAALVSLGACASAPEGRKPSTAPSLAAGGARLLYNVDADHPWQGHPSRDQVLTRTVAVMQRRVDALFKQGVVRGTANGVVEVVLPKDDPPTLERYRRIAPTPGVFQIKLVDDGSAYMAALVEQVRNKIYDFEGVVVAEDRWNDPGAGTAHRDPYLTVAEREALVAVLHRFTAKSPVPPDREILIETYGEASRSYRSYLVARSGGIDNADIDAVAVATGVDGHPEVVITLTADGRRKFGDMTAAAIGRKIALVIDGQVTSAPIVIGPIRNGRVHVRLGVYPTVEPDAQRAEAEDLAVLLRSGPLPAPLSLEPVH